jgi:hypothetical protein
VLLKVLTPSVKLKEVGVTVVNPSGPNIGKFASNGEAKVNEPVTESEGVKGGYEYEYMSGFPLDVNGLPV